jgi:lipopolysaccharide/colanic/teichoic acid biosynthesis glycosyltransferase
VMSRPVRMPDSTTAQKGADEALDRALTREIQRLEGARRNHIDLAHPRSRALILATASILAVASAGALLGIAILPGPDKLAIGGVAAACTGALVGFVLGSAATSPNDAPRQASVFQFTIKRILDIVISCLIMAWMAPLLAVLGLALKLQSWPEPILVRAARIGLHGRSIGLFRFRTTGRFGHFLERTALDQLPMLYNVLVGDLSLVGPRPRRAAELIAGLVDLPASKPGLVPPLSGRVPQTSEDWAEIEAEYQADWSVWKDFKILLRVVLQVIASPDGRSSGDPGGEA